MCGKKDHRQVCQTRRLFGISGGRASGLSKFRPFISCTPPSPPTRRFLLSLNPRAHTIAADLVFLVWLNITDFLPKWLAGPERLATSTTRTWGPLEGRCFLSRSVKWDMVQDANVIAFRRTGISLKEGRRDEHGMEEVDGLFSSPEKSPARLNGFDQDDAENEDSLGSEMSMDEGALMDVHRYILRIPC